MEILKFVLIGIASAVLAVLLKGSRPELALVLSVSAGALLIALAMGNITQIITYIGNLSKRYDLNGEYIALALKVAGISLLCDFGTQVCKDAGENAIASKVELGGKIIILLFAIPIIDELLTLVGSLLAI